MPEHDQDEVALLIENSKQLIAQLNQLLESAGAPIRFAETPATSDSQEADRTT
jgi:hypothetical protein